jgi:hypothetical protein
VSDFNSFFINFEFITPRDNLDGGGGLFISGNQHQQLNIIFPSNDYNPKFQYTFTPINIESFVGSIRLELTIITETEMSEVHVIEKFGIELSNGTVYSENCVEFHIGTVSYSTTEGPDNSFIPFDFLSYLIVITILPVFRRFKK